MWMKILIKAHNYTRVQSLDTKWLLEINFFAGSTWAFLEYNIMYWEPTTNIYCFIVLLYLSKHLKYNFIKLGYERETIWGLGQPQRNRNPRKNQTTTNMALICGKIDVKINLQYEILKFEEIKVVMFIYGTAASGAKNSPIWNGWNYAIMPDVKMLREAQLDYLASEFLLIA